MRILKKKKKFEVYGSLVNILPSGIHLEASPQFLMLPLVLELETSSSSCEVCTCSQGTPSCEEHATSPPPLQTVSVPSSTTGAIFCPNVWIYQHGEGLTINYFKTKIKISQFFKYLMHHGNLDGQKLTFSDNVLDS